MSLKHFGGKLTPALIKKYEQVSNWENGKFQNIEPTSIDINPFNIPKMLYKQIKSKDGFPKDNLSVEAFNKDAFLRKNGQFIWYGHSVILMYVANKTILIDPMLGSNASPIAPFPTKRFSENTLPLIDGFPPIDIVLLTHDHYDHLDIDSILKLKDKTTQFLVGMGVGRHLEYWGVAPEKITEFAWYDTVKVDDLEIMYTPTRHFSGRGLKDRQKSLWGGWFIKTPQEKIWFSGDGSYGKHFKEIAEKIGAVDLAFMECGQYNTDWLLAHMFPNQSVDAALEVKAKKVVPVHWAGFKLSYFHTWNKPVQDFINHAQNTDLEVLTPKIGQLFSTESTSTDFDNWWEKY